MVPAGFQCVPAGSKKSVPAGPGQRDDVAISDGGFSRQEAEAEEGKKVEEELKKKHTQRKRDQKGE